MTLELTWRLIGILVVDARLRNAAGGLELIGRYWRQPSGWHRQEDFSDWHKRASLAMCLEEGIGLARPGVSVDERRALAAAAVMKLETEVGL